jgi:transcription initiation factor IIE alpha subunit
MKFKCIHTGNVFEFTQEHDIKTMLEHPEYVEYVEYAQVPEVIEEPKPKAVRKSVKQLDTEE